MRSILKTNILIASLPPIPISFYSAIEQKTTFKQINRKTGNSIKYKRVDAVTNEEVDYSEIAKAYQLSEEQLIPITATELDLIGKVKGNIRVSAFIDKKQLENIFAEKYYYLGYEKSASKKAQQQNVYLFHFLRELLESSKKTAIAKIVMRESSREHLVGIFAHKNYLLLKVFAYKEYVRDFEEVNESANISSQELEMGLKLIEKMTQEFKYEDYKDTYEEELRQIIQKKASGEIIIEAKEEQTQQSSSSLSSALLEALQEQR